MFKLRSKFKPTGDPEPKQVLARGKPAAGLWINLN